MSNLIDSLHSPLFRKALLEAVLIGVIAGVVGVHVVLRRLPFFVVAMSHATFPGVVIASVLGTSLFLGGTVFGFVVVLAVIVLGANTVLDDSSVTGVVLGGSFALGVVILASRPGSSKDLAEFLVGSVLTVTWGDVGTTVIVGVVVLTLLGALHKELVLQSFDRSGAAALGYPNRVLDAVVLGAITVTTVTAIPAVGTLLAVALLTVPALTARLWTDRLSVTLVVAGGVGGLSGVLGLFAAAIWSVAAGGAIALAAGACFTVSLALTAAVRRLRIRGTRRRSQQYHQHAGGQQCRKADAQPDGAVPAG
jgi:ABC-type Mn2+/Zn2+ transport system permease subunit